MQKVRRGIRRRVKKKNENNTILEDIEDEKTEAELLVNFIKNSVESGNPIYVNDKDIYRKATYGDIAVLSRKRSVLNELAPVFQEHNIPYVLHSGTGFYNAQEVIDITSYLKFLHNQNDDIALAGILKSLFFGLPDTELFKISRRKNLNTLWEKFLSYFQKNNGTENNDGINNETLAIFRRAYETLTGMINLAPRLPISQLIYLSR